MNEVLVIYNTCGLSGKENFDSYRSGLYTLLQQDIGKIIISDCMSSVNTRRKFQEEFGDHVSLNFIDEALPVNVTFNHTVLESVKHFGEFDSYLYVDSGVKFQFDNDIGKLYNLLMSGPYGMVSSRVDQDSGVFLNFSLGQHEGDQSQEHLLFKDGDFVIPIGKAINHHVVLWSNQLLDFYNKLDPDIFASWCTESVCTFICAALQLQWVISKDVVVNHTQNIDVQSVGFSPHAWQQQGFSPTDHPFLIPSIIDVMRKGHKYGLGYEECQGIVMHDPQHYNNEGFCLNEDLKHYIKDHVFLSKEIFDYNKIQHRFIV